MTNKKCPLEKPAGIFFVPLQKKTGKYDGDVNIILYLCAILRQLCTAKDDILL